jgi:DNA primase
MIPPQKVDEIMNAARIEEVIGDFVNLKRAGASMKGLSPWTDEKTPSFVVSPAKGIYKDFSSGRGGNAVNFLMELEHFTYPEALRWLAKRYNIEVIEEVITDPAAIEAKNERESIFVINDFGREWFTNNLWETDEGKNIGLSYFKERGYKESTIQKFQLGYAPEDFQAFTTASADKGYKEEYLLATALVKDKNGRKYDGYRGRVIFPIQNLSGRTIGFGGRTLKADKNIPKYINSPENAVYDKSSSLYGVYHAKSAIGKEDNCFLVEGYTDVLSFHQKGIENTVASSGTALTRGQIQLIKRYSENITMVYDGDPAGIKASLRGIDLILEEGMRVKVVLLPDGHDPDTFSKEHDRIAIAEYLDHSAKDFIAFKADLLMQDAKGDPVKTNAVIHDMVNSIALIPDTILRSLYVNECSRLMSISETALISELNKALRKNHKQAFRQQYRGQDELPEAPVIATNFQQQEKFKDETIDHQERDIIRLMINYHDKTFFDADPTEEEPKPEEYNVLEFFLDEIEGDSITMENVNFQKLFKEIVAHVDANHSLNPNYFIAHEDDTIRKLFVDLMSFPYNLDDWERKDIIVTQEEKKLRRACFESIYAYKSKRIERMITGNQDEMKTAFEKGEDPMPFLKKQMKLENVKKEINKSLGRTVLH